MYQSPTQLVRRRFQVEWKRCTENDGKIEMMNPCRSCSDEDVYQVGDGVKPVEEEVESLCPSSSLHVVLHHDSRTRTR